MSWINDLKHAKQTAVQKQQTEQKQQTQLQKERLDRLCWLMTNLFEHEYDRIRRIILKATENGKRECHINFNYDLFKTPVLRLGVPRGVCRLFLRLCVGDLVSANDYLSYHKLVISQADLEIISRDKDGNTREPLKGVSFDVWGNGAFTTHFTWE